MLYKFIVTDREVRNILEFITKEFSCKEEAETYAKDMTSTDRVYILHNDYSNT